MDDTNLQRLPFSIKDQVVALLKSGYSNRQILAKVNDEHTNAIQNVRVRQGSSRVQVSMDDIGNLRARFGDDRTVGKDEQWDNRGGTQLHFYTLWFTI